MTAKRKIKPKAKPKARLPAPDALPHEIESARITNRLADIETRLSTLELAIGDRYLCPASTRSLQDRVTQLENKILYNC